MRKEDLYWLWLASLDKIDLGKRLSLVSAFSTARRIYLSSTQSLIDCRLLSIQDLEAIEEYRDLTAFEKIADWLDEENIHFVSRNSLYYPSKLLTMSRPPAWLFIRGDLKRLSPSHFVYMGGKAKNQRELGKAERIAERFASDGMVVMTSPEETLAETFLRGALRRTGSGALLLSGGVLSCEGISPSSFEKTARDGLLISEKLPTSAYDPSYRSRRNKILSALSQGAVFFNAKDNPNHQKIASAMEEENLPVFYEGEQPQPGKSKQQQSKEMMLARLKASSESSNDSRNWYDLDIPLSEVVDLYENENINYNKESIYENKALELSGEAVLVRHHIRQGCDQVELLLERTPLSEKQIREALSELFLQNQIYLESGKLKLTKV